MAGAQFILHFSKKMSFQLSDQEVEVIFASQSHELASSISAIEAASRHPNSWIVTNFLNDKILSAASKNSAMLMFIGDTAIENLLAKIKGKTSDINILADSNRDRLVRLARTCVESIVSPQFGVQRFLGRNADIHERTFSNQLPRKELCKFVRQYTENLGINRALVSKLVGTAEEMIMNIEWLNSQNGKNPHGQTATFSIAFDGQVVALCATDPWGLLTRKTLFEYLTKITDRNTSEEIIESKAGGAGLGLIKELYNSNATICTVAPGSKTEFICLTAVESKNFSFSTTPKTVCFFDN